MLFFSFIIMIFSAYIYTKPYKEINFNELKRENYTTCEAAAKTFNYRIEKDFPKNRISFEKRGIENWEENLGTASYVMQACNAFKPIDFCYGTCDTSKGKPPFVGLQMELLYMIDDK